MSEREASRALAAIMADQWAITPTWLETIIAIADRSYSDMDQVRAVLAQRGVPLANTERTVIRDGVAVVPVTGPIFRYANMFTQISGATSIDMLATDFSAALANPVVKAIVLDVNSPGGMVAGVSEFAQMVRAATATKPVVAYVGAMAASAAYWIAAAAGDVVINDTASAGSIGVILQATRSGNDGTVKFVSSQSPYKQVAPDSEAGAQLHQQYVDRLASVFIGAVADYRGVTTDKVLSDFGQGHILVGSDAVAAGMADRVGTLESVIASLAGSKTSIAIHSRSTAMSNVDKPAITREYLAANHSDLVAAIRAEGLSNATLEDLRGAHPSKCSALMEEGAVAERARIKGVREQLLAGYEQEVETMMFDGTTTAEQAAVRILGLERASQGNQLAAIRKDAAQLEGKAPAAPAPTAKADVSHLPLEERCKAEWEFTPALREEFGELAAYVAFERANANGQVRLRAAK